MNPEPGLASHMADEKKYGNHQYYLLKAEALCAELMANGVSFDDLIVRFQGAFRKSYRNDIEELSAAKDGSGQIIIKINRDSLYDKLPEGLFHQTRGGARTGGSHGTHVIDLAAGNGRGSPPPGGAPAAARVFVEVSARDVAGGGPESVFSSVGA